jgi:two-component system LytT family response regulator
MAPNRGPQFGSAVSRGISKRYRAGERLEAVESIARIRPDVVFLDIEMPGLNGFEVLQQFETRPFHVVFVTAYDEFAIRAFEEAACDYVLKPFDKDRLHQALERALSRVDQEARLRQLETRIEARLQKLTVRVGARWRVVEQRQISCIVSRNHYTCVYFDGLHEGISDLSIARLEQRLDAAGFRRLHRNSIVRVDAIRALTAGAISVDLDNGMRLPVARSRRGIAKDLLSLRAH